MSALGDFTPSKFSMIHAAADVVLIIGITVWLNGKISAQSAEIEKLKTQNEILLQRILDIEKKLSIKPSSPTRSEESEEIDING